MHTTKPCPCCDHVLTRKHIKRTGFSFVYALSGKRIGWYKCFYCGWEGALWRKTGKRFSWAGWS